jgi:hypothetical protein
MVIPARLAERELCMRGRSIPLSLSRRLVSDLLSFASKMPILPVQRQMHLGPLQAARAACPVRPSWVALFLKGFALTAQEFPELRRVYLKFPWPHLYEYRDSVAALTVERSIGAEPAVLVTRIKGPAHLSISDIDAAIQYARTAPIADVKDFRRALLVARLPLILRRLLMWLGLNIGRQRPNYFGTFCFTDLSPLGTESLRPLFPATVTLYYGTISEEGAVVFRAAYDHRALDGATIARALARLEQLLNGVVAGELR